MLYLIVELHAFVKMKRSIKAQSRVSKVYNIPNPLPENKFFRKLNQNENVATDLRHKIFIISLDSGRIVTSPPFQLKNVVFCSTKYN